MSGNSSVFGSTLAITPAGGYRRVELPRCGSAPDNSPAATTGTGTAITLGMTNSYNGGNTASDDILATAGTANTSFAENTWRIRGTANNGWATAGRAANTPGHRTRHQHRGLFRISSSRSTGIRPPRASATCRSSTTPMSTTPPAGPISGPQPHRHLHRHVQRLLQCVLSPAPTITST